MFDGSISTTINVSSRKAHQGRISLSHTHCISSLFLPDISPMYQNSKHIISLSQFSPVVSVPGYCFRPFPLTIHSFSHDLLANPEKGGGRSLRNTDVCLPYHTTRHHISESRSHPTVRYHISKHYITVNELRCHYVRFLSSRAATPRRHCARTVPVADLAARLFCQRTLVKIVSWKGSGNGHLIDTFRWEINQFVSSSSYSDEQKQTDRLHFVRVAPTVTVTIGNRW